MSTELVAFDLETTGLSPKSERVIEIGAVRFGLDGQTTRELQLLVDPGIPVPLPVQRLTGITSTELAGQPSPVEAVAQLAGFCEGAELVGHGAGFDLAFCAQLLPATFGRREALDTLELARILLPVAASHNLGALARLLGLRHEHPHRALSDAQATAALFEWLLAEAASIRAATFAEMHRVAAQSPSPLLRFFDLAAAERGSRPAVGVPARALGRPETPAGAAEPSPAAEDVELSESDRASLLSGSLADAAVRLIGPGGRLAERPGYEYREAQEQMARAVAQSLERGGRLLVEAGTGVGKTLGYLAPLALWAERGGGRAVVATRTITLQEQLAGRDLPALQPHLPRPLGWAVVKGRSHYISLRRFQRHLRRDDAGPRGPDLDVIRFKLKLLRWLDLTRTGDRAELHLGAAERELWRAVESTADDCLGSACANWRTGACHMVAARRAAATAELVVTNHALLLSGEPTEGRLLGDYAALVVDEAHNLEESATHVGGHRLRGADVVRALDRLPGIADPRLTAFLDACRDAANGLFGETKGLLGERLGGEGASSGSLSLSDELLAEPRLQPLVRNAQHAVAVLRRAAEALRAADPAGLEADLLPQPDRGEEELALAAAALEGSATAVDEVLLHRRDGHVAWLELRAEQAELRDAPVAAGAALGDGILDAARTVVLTSATLAIAGDFGFVRERLGLGARTDELSLASPYDYLSQALCVTVSDIPPYDAPEYEQALAFITADIARRLGGRTLGLFTGYGALRRIRDLVGRRLAGAQISVLGQGLDGTRRQLLASFVENPRTVLLGTSTFWEGIDVPGDALQCVIIAKLPFAVPTDPLVRARTAELRDPFGGYVLPEAVIRLRQGFGRLIRSGTDRGVVVIADSRLQSRDYARRFLEALPPAAVAREPVAGVATRVAAFVHPAADGGQSAPW